MSFEELYSKLNPEQKQAVDTVEGPVMVIAGPGTGKTHILTLRIANILKQTQAKPTEILALTFTHSAADTMRKRLATIVGEEVVRDIFITTFHSFCEYVLETYNDHFPLFAIRRPMSDIEQTLLFCEVLENAESNELRPPKAPYTYLNDLKKLYETLSREGMTLDEYRDWGEKEKERIASDPSMHYVRGEKKGELKKEGQEKLKKYDKVSEAAKLLEAYQLLKEERGVYDFGDMLRVAIDGIAADGELRATLQEQYQYILADEHQDANALQHDLLKVLAYDEHPNMFVVGDEKQAIYRFQGANVAGFRSFADMFPRTKVITLKSSFRSLQSVLDTAHTVIEETGDHEMLSAIREGNNVGVSVIAADDQLGEREEIAKRISEYIENGVSPHEIAVITRKNETANVFAHYLEACGIPVLRAGDISLTSRPIMRYLLALMEYAAEPTNVHALRFQVLAPWWTEPVIERAQFLRTSNSRETNSQLKKELPKMHEVLDRIVEEMPKRTPVEALSFLLKESGVRDYVLSHAEHLDDIPLVRLLLQEFEELSGSGRAKTFAEAVRLLNRTHEHHLSVVKQSVTMQEGMVSVLTAHKAKGMEFQYVFVPDLVERSWERGRNSEMIPSPFVTKEVLDDARRLFYVALTRAKDHAYATYAVHDKEGRERRPSILLPHVRKEIASEKTLHVPLLHNTVEPTKIVRTLTKSYLINEGLAPTALSEYLVSPPTFFARRVLKLHEPDTGPSLLGNAVHKAIACLLDGKTQEEARRSLESTFSRSTLERGKVFDDLVVKANESFAHFREDDYVTNTLFKNVLFSEKKCTKERVIGGEKVQLQGRIDAAFNIDGKNIIADFKTGKVKLKDESLRRQLAFYGVLLSGTQYEAGGYMIIEVHDDHTKVHRVDIDSEETKNILAELDETVSEMLSGSWRKGEPSEYDALLSLF